MRPMPWSYTSLDDFVNCPKAFYEKRVLKSVKEEESEQMIWGNRVHKAFEYYVKHNRPLPDILEQHEQYLKRIMAFGGKVATEEKVAVNLKGEPCGFFDKNVWYRGILDFHAVNGNEALIVDYKTGKQHSKFKQLKLFALNIFSRYPQVTHVDVRFYWTQACTATGERYARGQIPQLWQEFLPDLKQYAQAFKEDIWQPRQSGLCNGWCPVTTCEFWKPKRKR